MAVYSFTYTGGVQQWVAQKSGKVRFELISGRGAQNKSGKVSGEIDVVAGQVYNIYVGGNGSYTAGGWNGGGAGNTTGKTGGTSQGGGGATDVRLGGAALSNRIIVAGAPGGASGDNANAGMPGYPNGSPGVDGYDSNNYYLLTKGGGGTQSAGGAGGTNAFNSSYNGTAGSLGQGGVGGRGGNGDAAGGGGGGYYGGGGGAGQSSDSQSTASTAGGGSHYFGVAFTNVTHQVVTSLTPSVVITELWTPPSLTVNVGGIEKAYSDGFVNVDGVWKQIDEVHVFVDGVWIKS